MRAQVRMARLMDARDELARDAREVAGSLRWEATRLRAGMPTARELDQLATELTFQASKLSTSITSWSTWGNDEPTTRPRPDPITDDRVTVDEEQFDNEEE